MKTVQLDFFLYFRYISRMLSKIIFENTYFWRCSNTLRHLVIKKTTGKKTNILYPSYNFLRYFLIQNSFFFICSVALTKKSTRRQNFSRIKCIQIGPSDWPKPLWDINGRNQDVKRLKCGIFTLYSLGFLNHLYISCFDENYHVF